jgi:spore germination protein PB
MNLIIHQSISIHFIKIEAITNSSVFQIGSTGSIQAQSDIHNTGGFTEAAEPAEPAGEHTIIRLQAPD